MRILIMFTTIICSAARLYCQDVVVDWASKKVTSQPSLVDKRQQATVHIDNVNDLMYTYSISSYLTALPTSDAESIVKAFGLAGSGKEAGNEACEDTGPIIQSLKDLAKAEDTFIHAPQSATVCKSAKLPCEISLQQAESMWATDVDPYIVAAQAALSKYTTSCQVDSYTSVITAAKTKIGTTLARINGPHSIVKPAAIELAPDYKTTLLIDQVNLGVSTQPIYSVDIQPANLRLTLSAGALFSEVQNRSYAIRPVPNATGTGTTNVLSVDGISRFNPTAIALLNYALPGLDRERAGLALSSGPVFRLGSKSDASSFGYFVGVGLHLYHRLYVVPGFHLGQFAGFPAGFSQANQAVPTGFASPVAVNRWTWRFGIALTYKAKDFGQFGLTGTVKPVTPETPAKAQ